MLALGGTWIAAVAGDDDGGRREAGAMLEAAALSGAAGYALKQLAARERPYTTADAGRLGRGRRLVSVRCIRRRHSRSAPCSRSPATIGIAGCAAMLGYGLAVGTAYARMDHDAHWLSDTVAGAGLGIATARFVMKQRDGDAAARRVSRSCRSADGVAVGYTVDLRR